MAAMKIDVMAVQPRDDDTDPRSSPGDGSAERRT